MHRTSFSCKFYLLIVVHLFLCLPAICQQVGIAVTVNDPQIKVNVIQDLAFGAFTQGSSGGSISILPEAARMGNGTVVPLNFGVAYSPLILEIEGPRGSIVSILKDETSVLTGSNGGSMKVKLLNSNPVSPFIISNDAPAKTIVKIGAEILVGNSIESPPGNYSGRLNISFMVE